MDLVGRRQLAHYNISRLKAPLDAPEMKEFADFLAPVNRFAEESTGFVWRLTGEDGASSSDDGPMVVTNLTVWTDLRSLRAFTYQSVHRHFVQNRRRWFLPTAEAKVVLWWIEAGTLPTMADAVARLERLRAHGPTPEAFDFNTIFDPSGAPMPGGADA